MVWGETGVAECVSSLGHKLDNGHDRGDGKIQEHGCVPSFVDGVWGREGVKVPKSWVCRIVGSHEVAEEEKDGPYAEGFVEVADRDEVWRC